MAKRKKGSKVQKKRGATARGKARKISKSASAKATKRPVAKAKPKRAPVKKAAPKEVRPSAPVVETVAVEKPAPDVVTVTEGLDPAA